MNNARDGAEKYPNTFTIYDIRVCNAVGDFHQFGHRRWSAETWCEYQRFIAEVRAAAPSGLSLRDCHRWLWGKNKQKILDAELAGAGEEPQ